MPKNGSRLAKINPKTTSKYEGTYPKEFMDHCAKGGSVPEFCLEKTIDRGTFDEWCAKYPEMMLAKKKGKILAEGWWMQKGRENLVTWTHKDEDGNSTTTHFNTSLYKFIVSGRFRHTGERRLRIPKMIPGNYVHNLGVVQKMAMSGKYTTLELAAAAKLVTDEILVDQGVTMRKDIEDLQKYATARQEDDRSVEEIEDGA